MKANELRIGNYVVYEDDVKEVGLICEAFGVAYVNFKNEFHKDMDFIITPIPLTEEWLLKFGFEEILYSRAYTLNNNIISFNYNLSICKIGDFDRFSDERFPLIDIKHVHQLQNLYFALTGEELTLKKS